MPLTHTFTYDDMDILLALREQQEVYVEHGYGMGDYSRLVCPWCNGGSDECGSDPSEFDEGNAYATFAHEETCSLLDAQMLLDRIINWQGV